MTASAIVRAATVVDMVGFCESVWIRRWPAQNGEPGQLSSEDPDGCKPLTAPSCVSGWRSSRRPTRTSPDLGRRCHRRGASVGKESNSAGFGAPHLSRFVPLVECGVLLHYLAMTNPRSDVPAHEKQPWPPPEATRRIRTLSQDPGPDDFIYTSHAKEQLLERGLIVRDVL